MNKLSGLETETTYTLSKTSNRKCVALNLQGCLCLVPHETAATTQDTLYILGSLTNSTRTKKITRGISREKVCILKHQVAQNERCSFQLKHRLPTLLTAFLGRAVHSRHIRRISSLHRTDTSGEWVAYAEQTMRWSFLAAKLVKGVWKARKLYQEIAQKNPSTEHLPLRILKKKKKKTKG